VEFLGNGGTVHLGFVGPNGLSSYLGSNVHMCIQM
jgi:hypothetical protein